MVAVAAAGISGGVSLLGGILGRRAEKRAAARNRANEIEDARLKFSRIRESAHLGGFNPLTALQTTGGQGFAFSGGNVAPLASISMMTDGLKDFGSVISGEAAQKQKLYDLEYGLAKVKLDQVKAELAATKQATTIANRTSRLGNQVRKTDLDLAAGVTMIPDENIPEETPETIARIERDQPSMRAGGVTWEGSGLYGTAQTQEDVLGEGIVGDIIGLPLTIARFGDMIGYTAAKYLNPKIQDAVDRYRLSNMYVRNFTPPVTRKSNDDTRAFMAKNYPTVFD